MGLHYPNIAKLNILDENTETVTSSNTKIINDMGNNTHLDRMKEDNKQQDKKTIIFRGEVAYDINSLPKGSSLENIMDIYTKSGILVYDATLGKAPYSVKHNLPKSE